MIWPRSAMRFGLFGAAQAQRGHSPDVDSAAGFKDYIEYVIEAEALGYHTSFIVEHHFTGFGQVSAALNLLTWIGARRRIDYLLLNGGGASRENPRRFVHEVMPHFRVAPESRAGG